MKVVALTLDDNQLPDTATVVLTRAEMQFIAKLIGQHSHESANDVVAGGGRALDSLWDGLTGTVFNRFWDGGLDDAIAGRDA
ncbi:hypothetical protein IU449_26770 [Nocardia higoensis]|uniref:Uncharacterized protein n=1 Tax=Nocardia higoensis TaxID=228599 RepID=A0ABS0DI09_9NOCA|nr:hypothetical protein [Nocardia higoensis]MBF6358103.1 hypothetical protein [Nocardia higoensis]